MKSTAMKNPDIDAINALEYYKIYLEYNWKKDPTKIDNNTYTIGTRPLLSTIGLKFENLKLIAVTKAIMITKMSKITEIYVIIFWILLLSMFSISIRFFVIIFYKNHLSNSCIVLFC